MIHRIFKPLAPDFRLPTSHLFLHHTLSLMTHQFPSSWSNLNTILAHDWLTGMRGGERCLELLCRGFPEAPIFTLILDPGAVSEVIQNRPIFTSALQHLPFGAKRFRHLLPLFPELIEQMRTPQADLLISTSHCVAKGLRPQLGTKHLCYCFTPMRYGLFYEEYFGHNQIKKRLIQPLLERVQRWDRRASQRVDRFVAISEHVRNRILTFYHRDADVVYPPVDLQNCRLGGTRQNDFDIVVSALVPYKRVDLAVAAYTDLGFPLKVIGTGSEYEKLRRMAGSNIEFHGWLSDRQIVELYQTCRFLVFPGEEDFGIVPLEAQACGTPVIAYGKGGTLETLIPSETAVFFFDQTTKSLISAVREGQTCDWNEVRIRRNAERFGTQRFLDELNKSIQACLG